MQYFYDSVLLKHRPVLEVERELMDTIKKLSAKTEAALLNEGDKVAKGHQKHATIKMANFDPPNNNKVNLFTKAKYFESYEEIYSEIIQVNE
jgi:hypothetical protein